MGKGNSNNEAINLLDDAQPIGGGTFDEAASGAPEAPLDEFIPVPEEITPDTQLPDGEIEEIDGEIFLTIKAPGQPTQRKHLNKDEIKDVVIEINDDGTTTFTIHDKTPGKPAKRFNLKNLLGWFGEGTTAAAMIPQGFFSALLLDGKLFIKTGPAIRPMLGGGTFVTAAFGKFAIVNFFNEKAFKDLADTDWLKTLHPRNWTLKDVANAALLSALCGAIIGEFGGFCVVGLENVAKLLEEYDIHMFGANITDFLSSIARNKSLQLTSATASILANALSFPNIYKGAGSYFQSWYDWFIERNQYQKEQKQFHLKIEIYRAYLKYLFKKGDMDAYWAAVKATLKDATEIKDVKTEDLASEFDVDKILDEALQTRIKDEMKHVPTSPGILHGSTNEIVTLLLMGISSTGLYNFYPLSKMAINALFTAIDDVLGLGGILPKMFEPIAWTTCPPAFLAMIAMSIAVMRFTGKNLTNAIFRNELPLNTLNWVKELSKEAIAVVTALWGGGPNMYQAKLDNEPITLGIFALAASFLLEFPGLKSYMHKMLNQETIPEKVWNDFIMYLKSIIADKVRAHAAREKQKENATIRVQATSIDTILAGLRDGGYSAYEENADKAAKKQREAEAEREDLDTAPEETSEPKPHIVPEDKRRHSLWGTCTGTAGYMTKPFAWCRAKKEPNNTEEQLEEFDNRQSHVY